MITTSTMPGARDILMAFAAEGEPSPRRLEAYVKEHPALRRELTELAVEMVLEPSRALPPADAATERTVASAWARFQAGTSTGAVRPPASAGATASPDPFNRFAGPEFPRLAARLGVTPVFLIKVRDGLIFAAGFPRAFVKIIAAEAGCGAKAILALLERPASIPAGTMAKADGKPEAGAKQSFEEAVATSGLSAGQRQRLLAMAEAERESH